MSFRESSIGNSAGSDEPKAVVSSLGMDWLGELMDSWAALDGDPEAVAKAKRKSLEKEAS